MTNYRPLKVFFIIIAVLLLARIGYGQIQDLRQGVLQASIQIVPTQPITGDDSGKIQPGTAAKLVVTVENRGLQKSPEGSLYVRYAFAHPLENETGSVLFETEKKPLPSIEPGKKEEITFEAPHKIPSLLDFVRHDWSLREYQAIATINQTNYTIGTLAITFSAYYYPGIKKELPTKVAP